MTEDAKDLVAKDPDLAPGTVVGEYKVEEKIGAGGFGTVYRAVHPVIGKPAAIKVLHRQFSANADMVWRFVAEARSVNQIKHRGIIDIFSFGVLPDGRQYYVMELLEGMTLDELLSEKERLSIEHAIPILRGIARALDAAHAAGVAHRDLKPENVFITFDDDGKPATKILDFGIAKLFDETRGVRTQTGTPMGTPKYMSPEQARGVGVDHRTDVYSFGVMVFEMLTGRVPFDGSAAMDILVKQITEPPPAPSSVSDAVSPALDAPILRMLAKDAADRPKTLQEAVDELAAAAGFTPSHPTPSSSDLASAIRARQSARSERALAKTVAQATGPTLVGSSAEVGSSIPPKRRTWVIRAVAAASLIVGMGVIFAIARIAAPSHADPPVTPAAPASTTVHATAPDPTPEPPKKKDIALTVRGAPQGAELWLGAEKLGTAPGPVQLPRGAGTLTITIKASGYKTREIPVETSDDATVIVSLDKITTGGGKTSHPEIENPF
jgi:serine/threonine-protein kinase